MATIQLLQIPVGFFLLHFDGIKWCTMIFLVLHLQADQENYTLILKLVNIKMRKRKLPEQNWKKIPLRNISLS